ncbi:type IX secretion system protein PorQ [Flavobacterium salilacus subsp. salilacus]|uniref:type IX secretion system protein PorQ n=1 Tax=Flavobacterium TaxID=237 RepID=UPI0010751D3F|nr:MULTISPECIES: type IX secretion system protein PorQ [Flavobacterium]KAF2517569.1 type IX secretion system protein PorQ [Flavobacterium salilacus subsp. salilacus]MBE1615698.1 type IX secretion system protein PorQ [Flavobacterium sp. SaA2.13]
MFKNGYLYLLLFSSALSFSQIGGKSTYQFLNLVTSPRQAALGGKLITLHDYDVNQAIYNPATINPEMDNHLSVNYGSYYGEVTYGTAAYAYTYDRHVQTFHAGVSYVNYGTFEGRDEAGLLTGDFTGSEIALSFGYAYNIPWTDIYIGANAKLISSTLESYNSFGGAIDIGGIYIDEDNDINIALAIRNVGTQFTTYAGLQEKLPLEIIAGISQEVENVPIRWHVTLENLQQWNIAFSNPNRAEESIDGTTEEEKVSFINNALRHVIVGAELFPGKSFNLRVGYNFRRGEELKIEEQRNFSGISVGMGIRFNNIRFDYSYSRYTLAANTSLFGLMINLQ